MSKIGYLWELSDPAATYEEVLRAQDERLKALIRDCDLSLTAKDRSSFKFVLLESPDRLLSDHYLSSLDPQGWTGRRLFGPDAELRWRRVGRLLHAVFLTDGDILPAGLETPKVDPLAELRSHAVECYLWGERQPDGSWQERRLPCVLSYPVGSSGKKALLVICQYQDAHGFVRFKRFKEVKAI